MARADTFTQKEIMIAINNALVAAKSPTKLGEISEKRLANLYSYAKSLFKPLQDELRPYAELKFQNDPEHPELHLKQEDQLKAEEAVFICLAGALFFQTGEVMKNFQNLKLPTLDEVKRLLEKKKR